MFFYQPANSTGVGHFEIMRYCGASYGTHLHRDLEVIYQVRGSLSLSVGKRHETVEEGSAALVLSNEPHAFSSDSGTENLVMVFSPENVSEFARMTAKKRGESSVFPLTPQFRAYIDAALGATKFTVLQIGAKFYDVSDRFLMKSIAYGFCSAYAGSVRLEDKSAGDDDELLYRMLTYVDEHLTHEIKLADIAGSLGYEPHYLSGYFNRAAGVGLARYINGCRVSHARELLKDAKASVTEIAFASGFGSVRNFNRAFREYMGVSPAEYRLK